MRRSLLAIGLVASSLMGASASQARAEAPAATAGAAPAAPATPASGADAKDASGAPQVRVKVVKVRAFGAEQSSTRPAVPEELERLRIPRLHLAYARYEHEGTSETSVRWDERVRVALPDGGTYDIWPSRSEEPGHVRLRIEETPPKSVSPCMKTATDVPAGQVNLSFCQGAMGDGTLLFFISAEPIPPSR